MEQRSEIGNVLGTFTLLECARHHWGTDNARRFVHISTDEDARAVLTYVRTLEPVAEELNLMPWTYFGNMEDADLGAIYAYPQTVPAVEYMPGLGSDLNCSLFFLVYTGIYSKDDIPEQSLFCTG